MSSDIILPELPSNIVERIAVENGSFDELRERFEKDRYLVIRNFLEDPVPSLLFRYAAMNAQIGTTLNDTAVPDTHFLYGDPLMESTLEMCRPLMEKITGFELSPTYAFCRIYKNGDALHSHLDRPACQIGASMTLGYDLSEIRRSKPDYSWPIFLEGNSFILEPGDVLIYRGCEMKHWREAFEGYYQAQLFMFYVDKNGPNAEEKYDRRPALGLPDFTKGTGTLEKALQRIQKQSQVDSLMRLYRQRPQNS